MPDKTNVSPRCSREVSDFKTFFKTVQGPAAYVTDGVYYKFIDMRGLEKAFLNCRIYDAQGKLVPGYSAHCECLCDPDEVYGTVTLHVKVYYCDSRAPGSTFVEVADETDLSSMYIDVVGVGY